jgi:membrane protease YdiL (CAAX protease family)
VSTYLVYRKNKTIDLLSVGDKKAFIYRLIPWPIVGFIIYRLALKSTILIPFDFTNTINVFLLLILAPILEEFIFRFSLWEATDNLIKNKEIQIWISSLLFSIGHLIAFYMLPPDYRPFVLYQSVYVIILGIACSKMRQESNGLIGSILIHFLFNFGFYLGGLI